MLAVRKTLLGGEAGQYHHAGAVPHGISLLQNPRHHKDPTPPCRVFRLSVD